MLTRLKSIFRSMNIFNDDLPGENLMENEQKKDMQNDELDIEDNLDYSLDNPAEIDKQQIYPDLRGTGFRASK